MKNTQAFTLIELLVVVLIIGILAAVALPQYQKAVEKSRVTTLLSAMKTIVDAQDAYYLANGEYAQDIDMLSVDMPAGSEKITDPASYRLPTGSSIALGSDYDIVYGATTRIQINWGLQNHNIYCGADPKDSIGIQVCKSLASPGQQTRTQGCSGFTQKPISCDFYQISL